MPSNTGAPFCHHSSEPVLRVRPLVPIPTYPHVRQGQQGSPPTNTRHQGVKCCRRLADTVRTLIQHDVRSVRWSYHHRQLLNVRPSAGEKDLRESLPSARAGLRAGEKSGDACVSLGNSFPKTTANKLVHTFTTIKTRHHQRQQEGGESGGSSPENFINSVLNTEFAVILCIQQTQAPKLAI